MPVGSGAECQQARRFGSIAFGGLIDEDDLRARRVVLRQLSGGDLRPGMRCGRVGVDRADLPFDVFDGDAAGTQNDGRVECHEDYGRFDTDAAIPAVEDEVDSLAKLFPHVIGRGGTDGTEPVGAGSRDRDAGGVQQFGGEGMVGDADADRVESGRHEVGDDRPFGKDDRERTRPEPIGQCLRVVGKITEKSLERIAFGDVDDEGIEFRSPFRFEDSRDSIRLERIAAESLDDLGRERNEPPATDDFRCLLHIARELSRHGDVL